VVLHKLQASLLTSQGLVEIELLRFNHFPYAASGIPGPGAHDSQTQPQSVGSQKIHMSSKIIIRNPPNVIEKW
jgi:hypothetical protein